MLTKWILGNFKAISNKTTFSLAPITVLVGENSSGKSSVLQSILLMAQTLKATQSRQPLLLNGEFIRLGYLKDILHNGDTENPLEIGFELQRKAFEYITDRVITKSNPIEVDFQVTLLDKGPDAQSGILKRLSLKSGTEDTLTLAYEADVEKTLLNPQINKDFQMTTELRNEINSGIYSATVKRLEFTQGAWLNKIQPYEHHCSLYHFLPNKILETYNATQFSLVAALKAAGDYLRFKDDKRNLETDLSFLPSELINFKDKTGGLLKNEIRDAIYSNLPGKGQDVNKFGSALQYQRIAVSLLERNDNLEDWLWKIKLEVPIQHARVIGDKLIQRAAYVERRENEDNTSSNKLAVRASSLPESLEEIKSQIVNYFSERVYYLGPLREDPRFIYSLPPYPELTHVGLKGEFTASVLEKFKDQEIEYPMPPQKNGGETIIGKATLINALSQWLEYMGLLEKVSTTDRGKIGTELAAHAKGVEQPLDLTSIGVGVSQILPTLVMGLIAPKGTTFLLEQPELHLHPKVQSIVADFLLGLTKLGKQCIVETHSEYLVSRLRLRVAEDETNTLASQTSIYFVERFNGKSSFRKLDLNQYGALLEWPEGFMDQGPNESELIMKAALKKRKQSQASK